LEEKAAYALRKVQDKLHPYNLRIKVWDGYRRLADQIIFWNLVPDEHYVANPKKGSRHTRGCAVDLTLVDAAGNELPMGTGFDDFTERAHRDCTDLTPEELHNRKFLEQCMIEEGFVGLSTEWWHFDFTGWEQYPILDISFQELDELTNEG
jgi:D-alanyl-D-alanine dipeptidase